MPRLGIRVTGPEEDGEPAVAAACRKKQQHRPGGRRRGKGRGGSGGGAREWQSSAIVLSPKSTNHTRTDGSSNDDLRPRLPSRGSSFFPSASASGERRSLGPHHDALLSQLSLHLAGRDLCSGPDPYPKLKLPSFDATTPHKSIESERDVVGVEEEDEEAALDPARHSFSIALKECQNRRFRSDALSSPADGKHRRRRSSRPVSLDLKCGQGNDVTFSSPGFFLAGPSMKKSSAVSVRSRSGTFPSPSTPNYHPGGGAAGYQKGWSSERVPLPANSSRRYGSSSALLPFSNGRTLPSKWEDAEKWICSPVSGEGGGIGRSAGLPPHHRRPKSKSGPLGAPMGMANFYSSASPTIPVFDGGRIRNFAETSPFLTGVLITEPGCCGSASSGTGGSSGERVGIVRREGEGRRSYSAHADEGIVRSASVHGCSDLLIHSSSSLPSSRDELDGTKDASTMIAPVILRKDVATQMSPQESTQSSPKERSHFSPSTASFPNIEELESHFSKLEVRDVQVDDLVTVTRWSKKHIAHNTDKGSANIMEWKKKTVESRASAWEVGETAKCLSKFRREEAKITAWENLQKAKAEAAIRNLEMKLEKRRSSSMDKILNKLKSAQRKAQEMRNAVTTSQANQVSRTTKLASSFRKAGKMSSLSGCFTCHAF